MLENKKYTLVEYTLDGTKVVSAVHYLDLSKFMSENKDARIVNAYASSNSHSL